MVIERSFAKRRVLEGIHGFPVTGILGPRQSGKSTLAKEIAQIFPNSLFLDLESPSDLTKLQNPEFFLSANSDRFLILDEIQRVPEIFPVLRSFIDRMERKIRILVLGSASPELLRQSSESLAGRIYYFYLSPFVISEIPNSLDSQNDLWLKGGFPLSYLYDQPLSLKWREAFLRTIIEQDLAGKRFIPQSRRLLKFLTMVSHSTGQIINKNKIANSMGLSQNTISQYLDNFEKMFYLRSIPPYFANLKKRLVKNPKVYVRDSGLLHSLLSISSLNDLMGNPICGHSWESFCIENLVVHHEGFSPYFIRTSNGNEIDLILEKGTKKLAFEIKMTSSPRINPHTLHLLEELGIPNLTIVTPNQGSFSIHEKVNVRGLYDCCKEAIQ